MRHHVIGNIVRYPVTGKIVRHHVIGNIVRYPVIVNGVRHPVIGKVPYNIIWVLY